MSSQRVQSKRGNQVGDRTSLAVMSVVAAFCLAAMACGGEGGESSGPDAGNSSAGTSIVDHNDWGWIDPDADPFTTPGDVDACSVEQMKTESVNGRQALGIATTSCNYLTAGQEAGVGAEAGEYLQVRAWHFDLTAPEGESAQMALNIDGTTVWEQERPIPSESCLALADVEIDADNSFEAGAPVRFHVRNHGNNEYYFIDARVMDEPLDDASGSCP